MKNKLTMVLIIAIGLMPATVFGFTNPLKSYNLYEDVTGGKNVGNSEMSEFYSNSLRKPSQANARPANARPAGARPAGARPAGARPAGARPQRNSGPSPQEMEKMMEGIDKMLDINQKVNETMVDTSMSEDTKLNKLKGYNKELREVVTKYFPANSPEFKPVMSILDENDKFFETITNSNMTEEQKMQAAINHQEKLASIMKSMNSRSYGGGGSYGSSSDSAKWGTKEFLANYVSTTGRNADLRRSSMQRYANGEEAPQWLQGPSFYDNPSLDSIIEKYRRSNFTGCMQEAESYVRLNPFDTLGFYYLAMSYAKSGNKENAIKAYEQVIMLNDNPMIVKYATNGRNCVMGRVKGATCYQDVNVAEYKYPYREIAAQRDMTPINVQELIDSNVAEVQRQITPMPSRSDDKDGKDDKKPKVRVPFGEQDSKLDDFINAPYGDGFAPELQKENRAKQLKKLIENINREGNDPSDEYKYLEDVKNFDKNKSDASDEVFEPIKLAYDTSFDIEQLKNDPEYIKNKKEMDELNMLFGNARNSSKQDLLDIIPQLTDKENGISPQMFSQMMMNSVMPDIIDTDTI